MEDATEVLSGGVEWSGPHFRRIILVLLGTP